MNFLCSPYLCSCVLTTKHTRTDVPRGWQAATWKFDTFAHVQTTVLIAVDSFCAKGAVRIFLYLAWYVVVQERRSLVAVSISEYLNTLKPRLSQTLLYLYWVPNEHLWSQISLKQKEKVWWKQFFTSLVTHISPSLVITTFTRVQNTLNYLQDSHRLCLGPVKIKN